MTGRSERYLILDTAICQEIVVYANELFFDVNATLGRRIAHNPEIRRYISVDEIGYCKAGWYLGQHECLVGCEGVRPISEKWLSSCIPNAIQNTSADALNAEGPTLIFRNGSAVIGLVYLILFSSINMLIYTFSPKAKTGSGSTCRCSDSEQKGDLSR